MPLTKKLALILGARGAWQHSNLFISETNPAQQSAFVTTVGLSYQWHPWLSLFIRRAGNFRFPKADEQANTLNGIGGLKTQKGVSYEVGGHFNGDNWYGTSSVFALKLRNEIAFDPTSLPNQPFGANRNLDPTLRLGFLLSVNYQLLKNLLFGFEFTHVSAKFSSGVYAGNSIPFVATNSGSVFAHYQVNENWKLFAKIIFIGARFPAGDDANVFSKVPPLTLLNLGIGYHYHYFFANFRVNNLLNHFYNAYVSVSTLSLVPFIRQPFFYPAPGRNFLLTLGFKLS